MSSDTPKTEPKKGLSIVKRASQMVGDQCVTVSRYGFKRNYEDYSSAAKAIGCDHQTLFDKLQASRDGAVFVIYREHRFSIF